MWMDRNGLHLPSMIKTAHAANTEELREWRKGLESVFFSLLQNLYT